MIKAVYRNWKIHKTSRGQNKGKLFNCLDDESQFFFICDINNNTRVSFLKYFTEAHYYNLNNCNIYIYSGKIKSNT